MSQEAYNQGADQAAQDPTILSRIGSLADTAVNALQETYYNYRNRAVAAIAVGATALGVTAAMETAIDVTPAGALGEAANALTRPLTPASLIPAINTGASEANVSSTENQINYREIHVRDYQLLRKGVCSASDFGPHSYLVDSIKEINDTRKGELGVYCPQPDTIGNRQFIPRKEINAGTGRPVPTMDFKPLLKVLGTKAARSVGLNPQEYTTPNNVLITFDPEKHFSQAKFTRITN